MYADLTCVEVLIREFKSASADPHVKPVLWIRIQDLMTQNWKNAEETKIYFFYEKWQFMSTESLASLKGQCHEIFCFWFF
jgi:hypothetical protein